MLYNCYSLATMGSCMHLLRLSVTVFRIARLTVVQHNYTFKVERRHTACIHLSLRYNCCSCHCNFYHQGCSFQTPPPTDPETAFATLFSWLVEDVHLYKEYGVASNYSETICRLERMMRTQPNEYSLNATVSSCKSIDSLII